MKKLCVGTILLALVLVFPFQAMARVDVGISIAIPPPIAFATPPAVVVIPQTYVYAVPDVNVDIFFYNGWWWRPWEGRWYRSRHYNSGWAYYDRVPSFYSRIPPGWRNDYRGHSWGGHPWNYQRIPHHKLQRNWNRWERNRYWEKQQRWGVQGSRPYHPQNREMHPQQYRPQHREMQQQQYRPQHQEMRPQHREGPQHGEPQHGRHDGGGGERHDRR